MPTVFYSLHRANNVSRPHPGDVAAILRQTAFASEPAGAAVVTTPSDAALAIQPAVWRYLSHAVSTAGLEATFSAFAKLPIVPTARGGLHALGASRHNAALLPLTSLDGPLASALESLGCEQLGRLDGAPYDAKLLHSDRVNVPRTADPKAVMSALVALHALEALTPATLRGLAEPERAALFAKLDDPTVGTAGSEVAVLMLLPITPVLAWAENGEQLVEHVAAGPLLPDVSTPEFGQPEPMGASPGATGERGKEGGLWLPPAYFAAQEAVLPHVPGVRFVDKSAARSQVIRTLGVKQMLYVLLHKRPRPHTHTERHVTFGGTSLYSAVCSHSVLSQFVLACRGFVLTCSVAQILLLHFWVFSGGSWRKVADSRCACASLAGTRRASGTTCSLH